MGFKLGQLWLLLPLLVLLAACTLYAFNLADKWQLRQLNSGARSLVTPAPDIFQPHMVADLPGAARRYFAHAIRPGTVLKTRLEIEMQGKLGLGDLENPNYFAFTARQLIVPEKGFSWALRSQGLPMVISGSDIMWAQTSWTRFWLYGIAPVARMGGTQDHFRAAEGRFLVELAAWSPAALLPQNGVEWEEAGPEIARAWVTTSTGRHGIDVHLDADGAPTAYVIERWSDANPAKTYQYQPFGGTPDGFMEADGFRIAKRVSVGNHFGTPDFFPFFRAELTSVRFF